MPDFASPDLSQIQSRPAMVELNTVYLMLGIVGLAMLYDYSRGYYRLRGGRR